VETRKLQTALISISPFFISPFWVPIFFLIVMSGLDLARMLASLLAMEHTRAFKLLLVGGFTIGFSLMQLNAQAQQAPKQVEKKEISTKQLIPLLDFIFSNKINLKDTTSTKIEEPITGIWREEAVEQAC